MILYIFRERKGKGKETDELFFEGFGFIYIYVWYQR